MAPGAVNSLIFFGSPSLAQISGRTAYLFICIFKPKLKPAFESKCCIANLNVENFQIYSDLSDNPKV